MKAIQASNITFTYAKRPVVKGVSLDIEKGEFVSILGPNGSGKSTLLKTLSHVYVPDSGEILLDGKPIETYKRREIARRISMVPQDTAMDFEFTVEEVVLMGRHPFMGRFKKESAMDLDLAYEAMERTNTLEIKDRLITEISGGERQRVFIAKALAQNTSIMLLDEPTSHLDINHQIEVLELLKRLNSEKELAIVLVIHDINLAARYSDRILIMKDGEIIAQGRPEDAITPENIDKTYGMSVAVEKNRYTDHISVTPLEIRRRLKAANVRKIHIIGGGGTGQELMNKLYQDGYSLSLGVINVGDSDWQHAKSLRISVVEEKPFSGISEKASKKAMEKMLSSDVIVISETPIGSGNVANLKLARKALGEGVKVLKLCRDAQKEYDFTGGEGREILDSMRSMGLREFADLDSLSEEIDKI
jgi:iron complex transport system ATP-binding protein